MLHDNVGCAGFSSIWILYYEETLFSMMYGDGLFGGSYQGFFILLVVYTLHLFSHYSVYFILQSLL